MSENFKVEPRSRKFEGLAPLIKDMNQLTKNVFSGRGFVGVDLIANWSDIVGDELAVGVLPVRLTFPYKQRTNGVLHVRAAGGTFALLFEHQKARVIERVNTYFGYPAISEVRIVQGAIKLPKSEPDEIEWPLGDEEVQALLQKIDGIEDADLRSKTFELGVAMIQKRKRK